MAQRNWGPGGIARLSARRPWITILAWVVLAALIITGGSLTHQKEYEDDFSSRVESQVGRDYLNEHFGEGDSVSETLIFASDTYTVDDPEFRSVVEGTLANLAPFQDDFVAVTNYYDAPEAPEMQALVGSEGHALVLPIALAGDWAD